MAGRLRHRIELQRQTETTDETGQTNESWQTYARPWAEIIPLSEREYLSQSGDRAELTHRVTIRCRTPLPAPRDRVKHGDRLFDIVGVVNVDERNRFLNLRCTEGADA